MKRLPFLALTTVLLTACGTSSSSVSTAGDVVSSSPSSISSSPSSMNSSESTWDGKLLIGKHTVILHTSKGDITLELDSDLAPKTVTNFIVLAKSGYYNNLTFHRVIPGFMIQGGDPSGNGTGGKSIFGDTFEDELHPENPVYKTYRTGTIAMANRGPNTNGSQFFIMEADYPLPPNYTIFGRVTNNQKVVTDIATVERDGRDMPLQNVSFTVEVK